MGCRKYMSQGVLQWILSQGFVAVESWAAVARGIKKSKSRCGLSL